MNKRLPTKDNTAHFWADPSRELILAIECIRKLQLKLKNSSYNFSITDEYKKVISKSEDFLSDSGGSTIPKFTPKVDLYYKIPIFNSLDSLEINHLNHKTMVDLKFIGEGSYAKVYKYKDPFYKKNIIIKRAKNNLNEKELKRFKIEFDSMKQFKSPYIVEVYKYDEDKNEYYMEFMDTTLEKYINNNNNKLTITDKKRIVKQILKAFEYIHSQNKYHRDISPKNILVKNYDDVEVIKVADFGLIKIPESQLTNFCTEFKGYFNDPSLVTDGFKNYDIYHETYALTKIIIFVMTGKTNLDGIKDAGLINFIKTGLDADKQNRFQSVKELTVAFNKLSF